SGQAINNATQIVGQADKADGTSDAFLWIDGVMSDLGTLGGDLSQANAIRSTVKGVTPSSAPLIAGWSLITDDLASHAVVWDTGQKMLDNGMRGRGGTNSLAFGINCVGAAVGSADITDAAATDAFVWDSVHGMQDLGTLGGTSAQANGINCPGAIVGFSSL